MLAFVFCFAGFVFFLKLHIFEMDSYAFPDIQLLYQNFKTKLQCIDFSIQNFITLNFYIELSFQNFNALNFCVEPSLQNFNALNFCIELSFQNFNILNLFALNFHFKTSMHRTFWTLNFHLKTSNFCFELSLQNWQICQVLIVISNPKLPKIELKYKHKETTAK